ncbi:hypothetical protein ZHAS_00013974 [Anopheles sinensis]|uniref:Uncharacterized protein n=1 Tax=Anopheles sinensis TaxID=74873 RepID=A0A084W712_ANOSI|nr:hypothetical protein ZHAS_00013974 [Anopheles sinensis]
MDPAVPPGFSLVEQQALPVGLTKYWVIPDAKRTRRSEKEMHATARYTVTDRMRVAFDAGDGRHERDGSVRPTYIIISGERLVPSTSYPVLSFRVPVAGEEQG